MKLGPAAAILIFLLSLNSHTSAQSSHEDSILFRQAVSNTIELYNRQREDQSPFFNGTHYTTLGYSFRTGSPYFLTDSFKSGWVIYDHLMFDHVPLLYEELREYLVTNTNNYLLQFINQRISAFMISGHHFIRLTADSANTGISKAGFYEVLYDGRSRVLKETIKHVIDEPSIYEEQVLHHIDVGYNYYIHTDGKYKKVNTKIALIDNWNHHQKELRRFIRKNRLKIKKDKDNLFIQTAAYYDQLEK